MQRQHVKSTSIASIGYDLNSSTLEIEFQDGAVYDYLYVPVIYYDKLMKSSAKGRFLNFYIRPYFPSERR